MVLRARPGLHDKSMVDLSCDEPTFGLAFESLPDTPHAFFADYRASYREEPAEDGWKCMLAWFGRSGVG